MGIQDEQRLYRPLPEDWSPFQCPLGRKCRARTVTEPYKKGARLLGSTCNCDDAYPETR